MRLVNFYLRSKLLRALALIFVVYAAWVTCFGPPQETQIPPYRIDIDVYRLGGLAMLANESIYEREYTTEIGANLPFTYPPIAAELFSVLFAPISLPYATAAIAVASAIALYAVVWVVLREMTRFRGMDLVWATVGVLVFMIPLLPFQSTISFGQINVFLMLLVIVDLTMGRNRWWRGSLIGFAAALKLTPLVFGLYFLMRRDFRGGIQTLLAFGFWTAVGYLLSPRNSIIYWSDTLANSGRIGDPHYASNQSITAVLARTNLSEDAQSTLWLVAVLVLGVAIAALMWLLIRRGHHMAAILANALFGLLASPVSWSHHWVWVTPALMWLVISIRLPEGAEKHPARGDRALIGSSTNRPVWLPWLLAAVAAWGWLAFYYGPQFHLPNEQGREKGWTAVQVVVGNMWIWWTLAFFATLVVVALLDRANTDSGPVFVRQVPRVLRSRFGLSLADEDVVGSGETPTPDEAAPSERSKV